MIMRNSAVILLVIFTLVSLSQSYEFYRHDDFYMPEDYESSYEIEEQPYMDERNRKREEIPEGNPVVDDGEYSSIMRDQIKDDDDIIEEVKDSPSVFDAKDSIKKHLIIDSNALTRQVVASPPSELTAQEFSANIDKISRGLEPIDTDIVEQSESEFVPNGMHRSHNEKEADMLTADFLSRSKPAPLQSNIIQSVSDDIYPADTDIASVATDKDETNEFIEPKKKLHVSKSHVSEKHPNKDKGVIHVSADTHKSASNEFTTSGVIDTVKASGSEATKSTASEIFKAGVSEFIHPDESEPSKSGRKEASVRGLSDLDWIQNDESLNDPDNEESVDENTTRTAQKINHKKTNKESPQDESYVAVDESEFNTTKANVNATLSTSNLNKAVPSKSESEASKDNDFSEKDDVIDETKVNALAESIGSFNMDDSDNGYIETTGPKITGIPHSSYEFISPDEGKEDGFIVEPNQAALSKHKVPKNASRKLLTKAPVSEANASPSKQTKEPGNTLDLKSGKTNGSHLILANTGKDHPEFSSTGVTEPIELENQKNGKVSKAKSSDTTDLITNKKESAPSGVKANDDDDSTSDFYDTTSDTELSSEDAAHFQMKTNNPPVKDEKLVSKAKHKPDPEKEDEIQEDVLKDDANIVPEEKDDENSPDVVTQASNKTEGKQELDYYDTSTDQQLEKWPIEDKQSAVSQQDEPNENYQSQNKHKHIEGDPDTSDLQGTMNALDNSNDMTESVKEKQVSNDNSVDEFQPSTGSESASYEFKTSNVPQLRQHLLKPKHHHKHLKIHLGDIGALETPEGGKLRFKFSRPKNSSDGQVSLRLLPTNDSPALYDSSDSLIYKPTIRITSKLKPLKYVSVDDSFPELDAENLSLKKKLGESNVEENVIGKEAQPYKDLEDAVEEASHAIANAKDVTPKALNLTNITAVDNNKVSPSLMKSVQMALDTPENQSDQKIQVLAEDTNPNSKAETPDPSPTEPILIPTIKPQVTAENVMIKVKVDLPEQPQPQTKSQYHNKDATTDSSEHNEAINEEITLEDSSNEFSTPIERTVDVDENLVGIPGLKKPAKKPKIKPSRKLVSPFKNKSPSRKPSRKPSKASKAAAKNVMVSLRLLEEAFDDKLEKVESDRFQQLREKIQHAILEVYVDDDSFLSTQVTGFKASPKVPSTLVDVSLYFSTRLVNHLAKLLTQIETGKLGTLAVEKSFLKITVLPDQNPLGGKCLGFCPNAAQCYPTCSQMCCGVFTSGIQPPPNAYAPPSQAYPAPPPPPPPPMQYSVQIPPPMPAYNAPVPQSHFYGQTMYPAANPVAFEPSSYNQYQSRVANGYQRPYFRGFVYPKSYQANQRETAVNQQKQAFEAQKRAIEQAKYNAYSRNSLFQRGLLKPCGNGCPIKCSPRCSTKCCAFNK